MRFEELPASNGHNAFFPQVKIQRGEDDWIFNYYNCRYHEDVSSDPPSLFLSWFSPKPTDKSFATLSGLRQQKINLKQPQSAKYSSIFIDKYSTLYSRFRSNINDSNFSTSFIEVYIGDRHRSLKSIDLLRCHGFQYPRQKTFSYPQSGSLQLSAGQYPLPRAADSEEQLLGQRGDHQKYGSQITQFNKLPNLQQTLRFLQNK